MHFMASVNKPSSHLIRTSTAGHLWRIEVLVEIYDSKVSMHY